MIESADRVITSAEQQAGQALLRALRLYRADRNARNAVRLRIAETVYDSMPVHDRQVRDCLDDALRSAGWERVS